VEILNSPWTCFNASDYLALLVIDPEDDVTSEEVNKVEKDVREHGLSLLLVADWYDELQMMAAKYQDDNTRSIVSTYYLI
jgi:membrane-bound transcription factor site-1 protease